MHSLSNELLNVKIIHLSNKAIVDRKREKLIKLSRSELVQVATEVRVELNQPWITDTEIKTEAVIEESENVNVVLKSTTSNAVKLVKLIMAYTGTGAMQTKKLIDKLPAIICEKVLRADGKAAIAKLTNEFGDGAVFELQDC